MMSSKQCDFCHFYFYKNRNFKVSVSCFFKCSIVNRFHDYYNRLKAVSIGFASNISYEENTCLPKSNDLNEKLDYL